MKHKRCIPFVLIMIFALFVVAAQSQQNEASRKGDDPPPPDSELNSRNLSPENQIVPSVLNLPVGTLIMVRTTQPLSSDRNSPGEGFTTILDQPMVSQGWVVARRGQTVVGRVAAAQSAGRKQGVSQLAIELVELVLVDGQQVPIRTELVQMSGVSSQPREGAAAIGATTGIGAVIGAVAGGGKGAAIGAAIGAAAGVAGVLTTRGKPTEIYPETELTFRLEAPVAFSTRQSQQAFLRVTQEDFSSGMARNPDRYPAIRPYSPPPVYYYAPLDYGWYRPSYSYGYFSYRYYGSPRIYIRPGYRRHR